MQLEPLGRSGLYVSEICLGTMTFGGAGFWKVVGRRDIEREVVPVALKRA